MNLFEEFKNYAVKHKRISSQIFDDFHHYQIKNLTPNIIEERPMNIAIMDVYSRLMMDRIIYLGYPLSDDVANIVIAQLLFLDSTEKKRDIQLYINSPGGNVYAGLGVYDTMQYISADVSTICIGMAASMSAILLCSGANGKRTALQHSRIMLHQPSGAIGGQASDIAITINEMKKIKQELYQVIAEHTNKKLNQVEKDCDRDFWMTANEAKEYGIVDEVLAHHEFKNKK